MIIRMMTTSRAQQRYDHRLRDLVKRTGDLTIATDLGVERLAVSARPRHTRPPYSPGTDKGSACSGRGRVGAGGSSSHGSRGSRVDSSNGAMNPLWGAPRIHGELQKLGIAVSQATVAKYMPRRITTGAATTIASMQIQAIRTAPRSPWQNAYVERVSGSIRRECLDHVIILSVAGLQGVLADYVAYYLNHKDAPESRQGRTVVTTRHAALCRSHRRDSTGERPASPLRPCRGVARVHNLRRFGASAPTHGPPSRVQSRRHLRRCSVGMMLPV